MRADNRSYFVFKGIFDRNVKGVWVRDKDQLPEETIDD
ncbi:hypothetical protein M595_0830 [Lyngbya aestuarii BL J]|uniref:Uncharacterized protein n=1 Tax=Lyngbya aestuarii BL J TaxID=1348334 RepID=U7QRW3_9CYAN|nr:hypothetical protein M595_0830 [Lyngbya aestuarii BL J]